MIQISTWTLSPLLKRKIWVIPSIYTTPTIPPTRREPLHRIGDVEIPRMDGSEQGWESTAPSASAQQGETNPVRLLPLFLHDSAALGQRQCWGAWISRMSNSRRRKRKRRVSLTDSGEHADLGHPCCSDGWLTSFPGAVCLITFASPLCARLDSHDDSSMKALKEVNEIVDSLFLTSRYGLREAETISEVSSLRRRGYIYASQGFLSIRPCLLHYPHDS